MATSELRNRHKAAAVDTEPEYLEVAATGESKSMLHALAANLLVGTVIHYLLYWPLALIGMYLLYAYLGGWVGAGAVVGLLLLYAPSFFDGSERRLGRPWHSLRHLHFWRLGHDYTNLRIIRTAKLEATKQYVFGWHPHGILVLSRLAMYGNRFEELFPGVDVRTLGATPMFKWPGAREVSLWLGAVDASLKTASGVLSKGLSLMVYPGGSKEIFKTDRRSTTTELELRDRRGFIRLAMQHGASLVPVVVYNEREAYTRVDLPQWLRNFCLKRLKMPMLLFYGRFWSLLPNHFNLGVVFGAPMPVACVPDIQKDDPRVTAVLDEYIAAVCALWEANKAKFGYGEHEKLVVV